MKRAESVRRERLCGRVCAGLEAALKHSLKVGWQVVCQCSKPWQTQRIRAVRVQVSSSTVAFNQGTLARPSCEPLCWSQSGAWRQSEKRQTKKSLQHQAPAPGSLEDGRLVSSQEWQKGSVESFARNSSSSTSSSSPGGASLGVKTVAATATTLRHRGSLQPCNCCSAINRAFLPPMSASSMRKEIDATTSAQPANVLQSMKHDSKALGITRCLELQVDAGR